MTQEVVLGGGVEMWTAIGSAISDAGAVEEEVRRVYAPGDTVPPLYMVTLVPLDITHALHVTFDPRYDESEEGGE